MLGVLKSFDLLKIQTFTCKKDKYDPLQVVCIKGVCLYDGLHVVHLLDVIDAADIVYQAACCCLQNPVVTLAWLVANLQLLAPLISLSIDINNFCEPLLRTKPLLIIATVYSVMSYVAILTTSNQNVNPLNLFNFAQSFRLEFAGVAIAGTVGYTVLVHGCRRLLHFYEKRRLHPA